MSDLPAKIRGLGREKKYSRGASLFQADESARAFFFILSGEIRVYKLDDPGRELEVTRLAGGDFVGEAFALVHARYPFFAQAIRETRVIAFETAAVERAIAEDPETARFFVRLLARKCVQLSGRVESLGMRTVRQRLAEFLLSSCGGSGICTVDLPMKKTELARTLGTISETLSRTLRRMTDDGLITVRGKTIRIINCAGLRAETGSGLNF